MTRTARKAGAQMVASIYGSALVDLAREVGITQARLAQTLGVSKMHISHWKRGTEAVAPGLLVQLVKVLQEGVQHSLAASRGASKPRLARVLNETFHENLEALGYPRYASLQHLLTDLTAASTAYGQAAHPTEAQHAALKLHAGAINLVTQIVSDLAELLGALEGPELAFISGAVEDVHDHDHEKSQDDGRVHGLSRARAGAPGADAEALGDAEHRAVS